MQHTVLITGASGYLGGSLLAQLRKSDLPAYKLYALVRTDEQAEAVKQYGAQPLRFAPKDPQAVREAVLEYSIDVVFYLVDALGPDGQVAFIDALGELKKSTGREVHFLHTTGAKMFSSHTGAPPDRDIADTDADLYDIQKQQKAAVSLMQTAVDTNNKVIELSESLGVRSYIFAPCIVYGKGEGFGNRISIQTVAIVQAAKAMKRVYRVDENRPTWPVCHIADNSSLYLQILRKILNDEEVGHGKNGYFLASPGSVAWDDLYIAMAKALHKRGVVDSDEVTMADNEALEGMGKALQCPKEIVPVQLGGRCLYQAQHGKKIGWQPQYAAEHILEFADEEVGHILEHL